MNKQQIASAISENSHQRRCWERNFAHMDDLADALWEAAEDLYSEYEDPLNEHVGKKQVILTKQALDSVIDAIECVEKLLM